MATRTEAWEEARRLVVQEGLSYADAATISGIAVSTLQKRAAREDWQGQRSSAMSYANQVRALKAKLLEKALGPEADAQDTYAWEKVERAWPEHRYQTGDADPKVRMEVTLEVITQLVEFLAEHDRNALTTLQPHLKPFAAHMEARWHG